MRALRILAVSVAIILFVAVAVLLAFLSSRSSPIKSRALNLVPKRPFEGRLAQNLALRACEFLGSEEIQQPEDLAIDADGRIYVGAPDGEIRRVTPATTGAPVVELYATPGGWPQGVYLDSRGRLLATSHHDAVVSVTSDGKVQKHRKLNGADLAAASDGTIYVATISFRDDTGDGGLALLYDALEANPNDELLAYDPESGSVDILLSDLYMPAGVALSADEAFVAVTEATSYRVRRYWLAGPQAGTSDYLIEGLPGHPDGIVSDGAGMFYVAIPVLRSAAADFLHRYPRLKDQLGKLLPLLQWATPGSGSDRSAYGLVVAVDESGRIARSFHDPGGRRVRFATGVGVHDGHLYLVSVRGSGIARCPL